MLINKQNKNNLHVSSVVAQKCPVCTGFGTLKYGALQCHACMGKGYIFIPAPLRFDTNRLEDNK